MSMWTNIPNTFVMREIRSNRRYTFLTVIILGCIIITFFFFYAAFGQQVRSETLVSLHVLFRHGDRTPTFSYPTDPYINRSWPDGAGALTNKGKSQMYQLGKLIRSLYSDFLPDTYRTKELSVKSSYAARCQMSAATLLAGLYPPRGSQIWNEDLLWQPIPVNPIPRDRDNLIAARAPCFAFTEEKKRSDEEVTNELTPEQKKMFEYLSENSGMKIADICTAESLYYTLNIEKDSELALPSWTDKIYPEPLRTVAILCLLSYTRTLPLKRLQSGPFLGEWLSHLESDKEGGATLMYLYSGHDLTIINTMRSLGLMTSSPWIPDYGATLLLELNRQVNPNEKPYYTVKLLYLNSSTSEKPNELKLPNCDLHCPLESFKQLLEPIVPKDWYEECDSQP